MSLSSLSFFLAYYYKKHISRSLTGTDIFNKKLYRLQNKLPGIITPYSTDELLFKVKNVNGKPLQVVMRGQHSSDVQVMDQVFAGREYAPLIEEVNKKGQLNSIRFIIDAGCNVGYATAYFKVYFPEASVIAIEPDPNNYKQSGKNFSLNRLHNITLLEGGVWPRDAWLELKNDLGDRKEWSCYVTESKTPTGLKGFSFESILKESSFDIIDILKIDIEGAEKELFEQENIIKSVLAKTKFLAIEIHDFTNVRELIYNTFRQCSFEWFNRGELTIATNTKLVG